jgi:iron complex outermembrane receptor protein
VSDHANVYATYSKGFKSGTFDGILAAGQLVVNPVEPETVEAFEAGFKYGRGRTNFSVAGFYYDYSNIQFQAFNPNAGGLTQVFNAAAATIYGAEAEASVSPVDNLNLRGSVAWTHSTYDSFPNATVFCPRGAPLYGNAVIPTGALNPCTGLVNTSGATGKQLIRTPEFTASVSADYRIPVGTGAVEMSGVAFYSGSFFWDPNNRLQEGAYVLLNAEVAYVFPGDRLRLSAWGRNLANETYALYTPESAAGDSVAYARPRTFGVAARMRF